MADDIQALGTVNLKQRTRTNKAGVTKSRYTIDVSGDSILINTDPKSLGLGPAQAIAQLLRERIEGITATASAATIKARERAAKAYAEGKSWAVKQYSGGRLGAMPPNQSNRAFNDSGRLAKGIAVGATSDGYVVNFAANRWDPNAVKNGEAGLTRIFAKLKELVPELADPSKLMDSIPVRRAVQNGLAAAIQKADERTIALKQQLMTAKIQLAKQILSLVA